MITTFEIIIALAVGAAAGCVVGRSRYRIIETVPHYDVRTDYAVPVRRLLSIGETRNYDPAEWPDYAAKFGLGREHIAELIRLACDAALNWGRPGQPRGMGAPACLAGLGATAGRGIGPAFASLPEDGRG
jgi:hypothetical protein